MQRGEAGVNSITVVKIAFRKVDETCKLQQVLKTEDTDIEVRFDLTSSSSVPLMVKLEKSITYLEHGNQTPEYEHGPRLHLEIPGELKKGGGQPRSPKESSGGLMYDCRCERGTRG